MFNHVSVDPERLYDDEAEEADDYSGKKDYHQVVHVNDDLLCIVQPFCVSQCCHKLHVDLECLDHEGDQHGKLNHFVDKSYCDPTVCLLVDRSIWVLLCIRLVEHVKAVVQDKKESIDDDHHEEAKLRQDQLLVRPAQLDVLKRLVTLIDHLRQPEPLEDQCKCNVHDKKCWDILKQ